MSTHPAFLPPARLNWPLPKQPRSLLRARRTLHPRCPPQRSCPSMIQMPDSDGPPDLEAYFDPSRRGAVGTSGPPISLATGRAQLSNHSSPRDTAAAALAAAASSLSAPPQLCHATLSVDIDVHEVATALREGLPSGVPLIARSINKKAGEGTVEVLLLRTDSPTGITAASATVQMSDPGSAAEAAAKEASQKALEQLTDKCTFLIFGHTPGAPDADARRGLDQSSPGVIAYGGPAVGDTGTGAGWALVGDGDVRVDEGAEVAERQTVHVAAVPGSLSFLFSAVVKTWAQPAYVEPLSYMTPTYVDDPQIDLLTAIRYNDWDKFIWCIEDQGVDVNVKWVNKQNQIPLLAACARARTEMIRYLLNHGADVSHRNDGGFTAAMYTRMLTEYDRELIRDQLKMLEDAGASTTLTPDEVEKLKIATNGKIVE